MNVIDIADVVDDDPDAPWADEMCRHMMDYDDHMNRAQMARRAAAALVPAGVDVIACRPWTLRRNSRGTFVITGRWKLPRKGSEPL